VHTYKFTTFYLYNTASSFLNRSPILSLLASYSLYSVDIFLQLSLFLVKAIAEQQVKGMFHKRDIFEEV
jgi:hypothetical protein